MAAQPPPGTSPYGASPPAYGQQPQAWNPPAAYGAQPAVPAAVATSSRVDVESAGMIKWGYLLGVLAVLLFIVGFLLIFVAIASVITGGAGSVAGALGLIYAALGLLVGGPALAILGFLLTFLGFWKLKSIDSGFSIGAILALIGVVGVAIIAAGEALNLLPLVTGNIAAYGAYATLGYAGDGLAFLGAIGLLLCNMRAGTRYQESLTVPAILAIIPVLDIIGIIMLFARWNKIEKKLKQGFVPGAQPMVAVPMAVAPPAVPAPGYGYGAQPAYAAPPAYQPPAYQAPPSYQQPAPVAQPPAYQAPVASYSPPVAAAPAPVASPAGAPSCQKCGKPTTFVPQYSRYYCYGCAQYA